MDLSSRHKKVRLLRLEGAYQAFYQVHFQALDQKLRDEGRCRDPLKASQKAEEQFFDLHYKMLPEHNIQRSRLSFVNINVQVQNIGLKKYLCIQEAQSM